MQLNNAEAKKLIEEHKEMLEAGIRENEIQHNVATMLASYYERKAVLGFDIYRYSQFEHVKQSLTPYLFEVLYKQTIQACLNHEPFFFQNLSESRIRKRFIDTGDGGFQIFDSPMHALLFAIYFQANIKRYNSGHISTIDVKNMVGEITLRYSLTYDDIFCGEKNHYGPAIINNSRIMGKDKLNRFLFDSSTVSWFNQEVNGLDTLPLIDIKTEYLKLPSFKTYDPVPKERENKTGSWSIISGDSIHKGIVSSHIMHIGELQSKMDVIDVYNVYLQARLTTGGANKLDRLPKIAVSLGNLNSSGIN